MGELELWVAFHIKCTYFWLTLLVIWRFGRLIAMLDGIDTQENMPLCSVSFSTGFKQLWQHWHASWHNLMVRYMYIPLGGRDRPWLTVPLVFIVSAIFHFRHNLMLVARYSRHGECLVKIWVVLIHTFPILSDTCPMELTFSHSRFFGRSSTYLGFG